MKTFCEKLILSLNPKLKEEDLEMLDKLSKEFDILSIKNYIIQLDISSILSWLIINKLPYQEACKFLFKGLLYNPIVWISDTGRILITKVCENNESVAVNVTKMNRLLGYAS